MFDDTLPIPLTAMKTLVIDQNFPNHAFAVIPLTGDIHMKSIQDQNQNSVKAERKPRIGLMYRLTGLANATNLQL